MLTNLQEGAPNSSLLDLPIFFKTIFGTFRKRSTIQWTHTKICRANLICIINYANNQIAFLPENSIDDAYQVYFGLIKL
jgi:hypothetical protein